MLWVYGHYKCFNSFSAETDYRSQNLTSTYVRFWRIKPVPALEGLTLLTSILDEESSVIHSAVRAESYVDSLELLIHELHLSLLQSATHFDRPVILKLYPHVIVTFSFKWFL